MMKRSKKIELKISEDGIIIVNSEKEKEEISQILEIWKQSIENAVRLDIYDKICFLNLTENRAQIVKNGIENTALTVQDICARIALGKEK
jgi:co-chaperonin GroES (HSP10)